ncbi:MAG: hypothetical protein KC877_01160 [Candidatus Kaiserbacteria bacterium]|nr:hypothetical protein [Candidatus Kaiserbacteria bacterium]MCB9816512.1 hypothetical protein [Candidatus Nomurabacteria bacterium]
MKKLRHYLPALLLLTPVVVLLFPNVTFAADPDAIHEVLWGVVVSFFGHVLAGTGGLLLNYGVNDFVIGFGHYFNSGGVGVAVNQLWASVRDLFNITFIFGLVYLGFRMILNSDDSSTRRALVYLILAALLVNFSLFITKFVVDFSNVLATQIVTNGFPLGSTIPGAKMGDWWYDKYDISGSFMNDLGITTLFGQESLKTAVSNKGGLSSGGYYGFIFGAMILFIIMAFVFAAGGILLIIRFAALCLYMVLSPLMFLGWVFPQLQSVTSKYWRGFLGRAFFAPLYLLLVYFAGKIIYQFYGSKVNGEPNFAAIFGRDGASIQANFGGTIPPFVLSCVFLIAAIVVANKMSADGSAAAIRIGQNLKNRAQRRLQRTAQAVPGAAWRGTKWGVAHSGAGAYARSKTSQLGTGLDRKITQWQASDSKLRRMVAGTVVADTIGRSTASKMQNSKFGLKDTQAEHDKKVKTIESRRSNRTDVRDGANARNEEARYDRSTHAIDPDTNKVVTRESLQNDPDKMQRVTDAEKARDESIQKMRDIASRASVKDLEEMFQTQPETFEQLVSELKPGQIEGLMKSDNLTGDVKGKIAKVRDDAFNNAISSGGKIMTDQLAKLSAKQIENLGAAWIRENAHLLTSQQMDGLDKSDGFNDQQKSMFKASRKAGLISTFSNASPEVRKGVFHDTTRGVETYDTSTQQPIQTTTYASRAKKPSEIAKLPPDILLSNNALEYINAGVLEEIYKQKTLDATQRDQLRDAVLSNGNEEAKKYLTSKVGARDWNTPDEYLNQSGSNSNSSNSGSGNSAQNQSTTTQSESDGNGNSPIALDSNVGNALRDQNRS